MRKLLCNLFILVGLSCSPLSHAQIVLQALEAYSYTAVKSASLTATFTKNNCPSGEYGSQVTYTTSSYTETRTSSVSQDDANNLAQNAANAKAQADLNANGQTYANNNGTCNHNDNCTSFIAAPHSCGNGYILPPGTSFPSTPIYFNYIVKYQGESSCIALDPTDHSDLEKYLKGKKLMTTEEYNSLSSRTRRYSLRSINFIIQASISNTNNTACSSAAPAF